MKLYQFGTIRTLSALGVLLSLASLTFLSGCGKVVAETRTDPQGRVSFQLPAGWTEAAGSGGTRFQPPASMGSTQVQVNTVDYNDRHSIEDQRDSWLAYQREIGQKAIFEDVRDANGFHIVEYAHTGENVVGSSVWHYILLQKDDYIVATYLMSGPDSYESQLPIFREIVDSIQPAAASDT